MKVGRSHLDQRFATAPRIDCLHLGLVSRVWLVLTATACSEWSPSLYRMTAIVMRPACARTETFSNVSLAVVSSSHFSSILYRLHFSLSAIQAASSSDSSVQVCVCLFRRRSRYL